MNETPSIRQRLSLLQKRAVIKSAFFLVLIALPSIFYLLKYRSQSVALAIFESQQRYLEHLILSNDFVEIARQLNSIARTEAVRKIELRLESGELVAKTGLSTTSGLTLSFYDNAVLSPSSGSKYVLSWRYQIPLSDVTTILASSLTFVSIILLLLRSELGKLGNTLSKPLLEVSELLASTNLISGPQNMINKRFAYEELDTLVVQYNKMIARNQEAENRIKLLGKFEALSQVAAQVSHDIRSPLSALKMSLTLDHNDQATRELIRNSIDRINRIANDLLERAKRSPTQPSSDEREAQEGELELTGLVNSIVSEKVATFRNRPEIEIIADFNEAPLKIAVPATKSDIERVLSNLINNSAEAIHVSGQVKVSVRRYKSNVSLSVSDNGRGMDETALQKAGSEQFSKGKTGHGNGNGLGLLHAKQTVEKAGGRLRIQSKLGYGTIVEITLPTSS